MSGELVILLILVVLIAEGGRVWWRGERKLAGCLWGVALVLVLALTRPWESIGGGETARKNACIANLAQMRSVVQQWAQEHQKQATNTYALSDPTLLAYLKGSVLPACPGGGHYSPGAAVTNAPTCSLAAKGHTL